MTASPFSSSSSSSSPPLDVVVIGGGSAGMAAALVFARGQLNVVVVDSQNARNRVVQHTHGFFTRDGASPVEIRTAARQQLERYPSIDVVDGRVEHVAQTDAGFDVVVGDTTYATQRVVVATGHRDHIARLEVPGLVDVYGTSVFPCPFCDGFEQRDKRVAVFAVDVDDATLEHYVAMVMQMSTRDVRVFTHGRSLSSSLADAMARNGVVTVDERIRSVVHDDGVLTGVDLDDGTRIPCGAGFVVGDYSAPATSFAVELGAEDTTNPWGMHVIVVDEEGKTSVPGLYAVGDATAGFSGLTAAVAQGSRCAGGIVRDCAMTRWHTAGAA